MIERLNQFKELKLKPKEELILKFGAEIVGDRQLLESIAELYAQVFAGPPWNEFSRCPGCGRFYDQNNPIGSSSSCCGQQLVEAYPLEETINYIETELGKPNAVLVYLVNPNGEIIGFAWGYQTTPQDFVDNKYQTDQMRQKVINSLGLSPQSLIFYFSECGIDPEYRRKGYANKLTRVMVDAAQSSGLPLLMRTNSQSPMVAVTQRFGMQQCFGPEVIYQDGKIITTENAVNGLDNENLDRVLFLKI